MAGIIILSIQWFPFFWKCLSGTNESLVYTAKKNWKSWIIYQFPPFPIPYLELDPLVLSDSCRNPRFLDSEQFAMGFPDGIHKHPSVTDQLLDRRCIIVKSYQTTRNPGFKRKSQNVVQAFTYPASYSFAGNP